jgi:hypothetical protein
LDFGEPWHRDPATRRESLLAMRGELRTRFPGTQIGGIDRPDTPLDLLTGVQGGCLIAAIYGVPVRYISDQWPTCEASYLTDEEVDHLEPTDLDRSPAFQDLMAQVDWIEENEERVEGFINWQGILNNAQRLRGQQIFLDLLEEPDRCRRLFECICTTMLEATQRLRRRQQASGVEYRFNTISNCLVNMVSPRQYRDLLLPYDRRLAEADNSIGIHNCAWVADPYLADYATLPRVSYIDMGLYSDLPRARELFPDARRAIMYTPMDLANKPLSEIQSDLERIAREYGPSDVVLADIEAGTPDQRVLDVLGICSEISERYDPGVI